MTISEAYSQRIAPIGNVSHASAIAGVSGRFAFRRARARLHRGPRPDDGGQQLARRQRQAVSAYPELLGKVVPETNGNGLMIDGRYMKQMLHHVRVADCTIVRHPGGGLSGHYADWLYFEHNVTSDNAWFTNYVS